MTRYKSGLLFGEIIILLFLFLGTPFACAESRGSEENPDISSASVSDLDSQSDLANLDNTETCLPAYLDTGLVINSKMKSLAAGTPVNPYDPDTLIKAILVACSLPDDFVPSSENTISLESSPMPIYILFDNADDAGLMYVYTAGDRVVADSSLTNTFCFMKSLSNISGLSDWDVSNVTDLGGAFSGTTSLSDISPLSKWNTEKVESFHSVFFQSGITDASPLSDWNTSSATTMKYMFAMDTSLKIIDVSGWNTGKVTNMIGMFGVGNNHIGNGQLSEIIGLENLDVSAVTDMTCMFYGAGNMTHYDIAGWNVSNVESFNHMFCDNYKLESLDLSAWNVSKVKTMYCMFNENYALKTIGDVSHWNTSSLVDAGGWLNYARSFVGEDGLLDLSGWKTENLMSVGEMFRDVKCSIIDLSGWTFYALTNDPWPGAGKGIYYASGNRSSYKGMAGMFINADKLNTVRISFPGYISYINALLRGTTKHDMWKGVPESYFTLPYIPQPLQKLYHSLSSIIYCCQKSLSHFVLDFLWEL